MSGGDEGEGSDGFRDALEGVRPLDRGKLRPEPRPDPRGRGPAAAGEARVEFAIESLGERVEGLAPGADRRVLDHLARGEPEPEARVDLHGLDAAGAEPALRRALLAAHEAGHRCVLVIHGRGRRSEGPAVLRESLPGWLAEPPLGPRVLAFATAARRHGGPGASYVLLRARSARGRPKR